MRRDSAIDPGCHRLVVGFAPAGDDDTWSIDHWPMGSPGACYSDRRGPGFVQGSGVEDIALDCGDQHGFVGRRCHSHTRSMQAVSATSVGRH